jgi:predicted nucleic acid-binding protein
MNVIVDTSVWSLALRRRRAVASAEVAELAALIEEGRVALMGPVRQELLSGVSQASHYAVLRDHLRSFPDIALGAEDYEEAATFFNQCRAKGIQGSNTDFLICAVAARRELPILTTDADFVRYAKLLPIRLHAPRASAQAG